MAQAPGKKLRYGFIGAGGIAGEHMNHLAERKDVEIVALADPNGEIMARHATKFGVKQTFADWRELSFPARRTLGSWISTQNSIASTGLRYTLMVKRGWCPD